MPFTRNWSTWSLTPRVKVYSHGKFRWKHEEAHFQDKRQENLPKSYKVAPKNLHVESCGVSIVLQKKILLLLLLLL